MASPSSVGRRRGMGLPKQLSSEDQALNQIAKEAEARLAAKRAARAEARSIRMKELERKQKEADEQAERSFDDDDDFVVKKKVTASRISPATSSLYNAEPIPQSTAAPDPQLKESLREAEERYRKAMVNNAQLDNERQALQYQVECLKDVIEDLEESLHNVKDELLDKTKEHNKLTREHTKTEEELAKCAHLLESRERILDEHGLNLDGTLKIDESNELALQDDVNGEVSSTYKTISTLVPSQDFQKEFEAERESLLSEIETLRNELADLKNDSETDTPRRGLDLMKPDHVDLERSFVDVSHSDASPFDNNIDRNSSIHTGMYVNNNEKCDEFEVIDDGSQQGGVHNFEDKSFEQSIHSSLLSSVQTDDVEESMESEVPLEISVDMSKQSNRDEYHIVNMGDDASKATAESHATSPADLDINKYLSNGDDCEDDEELTLADALRVDRYFASDDVSSVIEFGAANTVFEGSQEEKTSVSDKHEKHVNDEMNYDNIEVHDVHSSVIVADEPARCSPYLEVEASPSRNDVIPDQSPDSNSIDIVSETFEEKSVEVSELHDKSVGELDEAYIADESQNASLVVDNDSLREKLDAEATEIIKCTTEETDLYDGDGVDLVTQSILKEESDLLNTEDDKPEIINTTESTTHTDESLEVKPLPLDVSQDVVDLYDRIANIGDENISSNTDDQFSSTTDDNFSAAFGIFGTTGKVVTEGDDTTQKDVQTSVSTPPLNNGRSEKPNGWLVRVESFNAPERAAPEIKIVKDVTPPLVEVLSPQSPSDTPVAKERKKKKKKKKNKLTKHSDSEETAEQQKEGVPTPASPELLGHELQSQTNVAASSTKTNRLSLHDEDIPQQFLDVSNSLAADSLSDLSDIEPGEDGTKKKREGSKKGNKKENCKTQ